jgi:predicted Zn-dependent protease
MKKGIFYSTAFALYLGMSVSGCGTAFSSISDSLFKGGLGLARANRSFEPKQEYYIGRSVAALLLDKYPAYTKEAQLKYVNLVGRTLANASEEPETYAGYRFGILDTPEIAAYSTPGGFVFITKGFLQILPDEDALAAVLAHELGHVIKKDGVNVIKQNGITESLTSIGRDVAVSHAGVVAQQLNSLFGSSVQGVFDSIVTKGYGRSQEYAADAYSESLLKQAGYNPESIKTVLSILKARQGTEASGGWFSTHPAPQDRIDNLGAISSAGPEVKTAELIRQKRFERIKW